MSRTKPIYSLLKLNCCYESGKRYLTLFFSKHWIWIHVKTGQGIEFEYMHIYIYIYIYQKTLLINRNKMLSFYIMIFINNTSRLFQEKYVSCTILIKHGLAYFLNITAVFQISCSWQSWKYTQQISAKFSTIISRWIMTGVYLGCL